MEQLFALIMVILIGLTGCSTSMIYSDEQQLASDNNSYNLDVMEEHIEDNNFFGQVTFEGMDTIWKYNANEDSEIQIQYLLNLTKGKAKLILIFPDGTLTTLVETTAKSDLKQVASSQLMLKKGKNRIKLVADNKADILFEIEIEVGEFFELGM